jgi:NADH dehydrogenase/NADH:ubiquinone oxidoreductase subunit G
MTVTLTINDQEVSVNDGTTIREAAKTIGIDIPTICYHPHFTANSLCRICVVEMERSRVLVPACSRLVEPGMVIRTDTPRVRASRQMILAMLDSAVDLSDAPEIQQLLRTYESDASVFAGGEKRDLPLYDDNAMYIRDYSKCVLCWRCVQACGTDIQYTFALTLAERGFHTRVATFDDVPIPQSPCVYCGNCVAACPTGALKPKREWLLEQGKLLEPMPSGPKRRRKRDENGEIRWE